MSSKKSDVTRRDFLRNATKTAAGVTAATTAAQKAMAHHATPYKRIMPQAVMGANEKLLTGHIGVGNMGRRDLQFAMATPELEPIAVCDLFPRHTQIVQQIMEGEGLKAPSVHTKFEEIIENDEIDAVVVVTPDHWHTIPTIMALEAGKPVYCEKPMATTLREGFAIHKTVKDTGMVYQSGTMQRSGPYFQEAVEMLRNGYIGDIGRIDCWNNDESKIEGIGNPPDEDVPSWLDWDRYVGWTPKVPFNKNRFIYNFRWFTDYSGGKITDWGAHLLDIAMMVKGDGTEPKTVTASGGNFILQDNRTTPDTIMACWEFEDWMLTFSNRAWNPDFDAPRESPGHGIMFHGTLGTMRVDRMGYKVWSFRANGGCEPVEKYDYNEGLGEMNLNHWANWVECIKNGGTPTSSVETALSTIRICTTGKAAYLAGGKLTWDSGSQMFTGGDAEAVKTGNHWLYRPYENGWSLDKPYNSAWA